VLTGAVTTSSGPGGRRLLRWLRRLVLVALALLLVLHLGGGWYFANRIRADGLEVKPYPVERHLTLTPAGSGTLAIEAGDPKEARMLRAPTTYGLKWRGGYGRVSGPVVSHGHGQVVRRFALVEGDPPTKDQRAELDLVAFPDDPTFALGPEVTEVSYASSRGDFPAYLLGGQDGDEKPARGRTWAILVHGKGGSRAEMFRMARATVAAGLPTLDITYRNDEGHPGDPSGYYQYGRTEWRDLRAAVAYATAHGADRVVLGADSMGGSVVASYLRHRRGGGAPEVAGLVLDAPMLDFGETVSFGARQLDLPLLGHVPDSLTWTAKRIAAARFDVDWDALDYLHGPAWVSMPTLVFHGTADTTVPIATSRALARAEPDLVTLVETKGVEHVRSWNADPQAYQRRIERFLAGL
jgi:pimeloyl-ACP methyl ester carboxylesterase